LRPGNAGRKAASRQCFLRQHYLGQVQRVFRVPRETLSLAPTAALVGSPNSFKLKAGRPEGQPAKFIFKKVTSQSWQTNFARSILHSKLSQQFIYAQS
jgi:hypothetical protein